MDEQKEQEKKTICKDSAITNVNKEKYGSVGYFRYITWIKDKEKSMEWHKDRLTGK